MTLQPNTGLDDAILELLHLSKYTKRHELRLSLQSKGYCVSDRLLRLHIETLITQQHYSIGSCEKGYWLILTKEDLEEAKHQLKSKAEALSIRANCLERNFSEGKLTEQLPLFS